MAEESVTVMLLPGDDTEMILEKVRRAGSKKVNLIVPPGNRALQTLGGFTMLRKACDITGIDLTVYSDDEKARDMAQVCRFEVVSLDQEVRPREAPLLEEEVPIVVSTRPPEPAAPAVGETVGRPAALEERLEGLSEDDLALFDALEGMSLTEDVELRPEAFSRPARVVAEVRREETPVRRERPARERRLQVPLLLRRARDQLGTALSAIAVAGADVVTRVGSRFQRRAAVPVAEAEAAEPIVEPRVRTDEELRQLRAEKLRYYGWTVLGVCAVAGLLVGIYFLSLPKVIVTLTPRLAETQHMAVPLNVVLVDAVEPQGGQPATVEGGAVTIQAQRVEVDLQGESSTQATGESWIPESTATGAVVFVNLTAYGASVPAGTRLSGGGAVFHTTQDVWVPASDFRGLDAYLGKAQVNIVADTPGSAGNVDAAVINTIEGNLAGVLTVENIEATSGGTERQVTVVTAEDHERLRQQLVTELQKQAYVELEQKLAGLQVISGTLKIETVEEVFSQPVGSEVEVFALKAKVKAYALACAQGALVGALEQAARDKIGERPGQEIGEPAIVAIEGGGPGTGINSWTYRARVVVPIQNQIDDRIKAEIRGKLQGKDFQQIQRIMAEYRDRVAGFSISPVVESMPAAGRIWVIGTEASAP